MVTTREYGVWLGVVVAVFLVTTTPLLAVAGTAGTGADGARSGAATPVLQVGDASMDVGGSASVTVTLSEVPNGLSGFKINVTVSDPAIAEISGAAFPSMYSLTSVDISQDNATVTLKAADLENSVQPGDSNVELADVELTGVSSGTVTLSVVAIQVDDDDGGAIEPDTREGSATVEGSDSTGSTATATPAETATPTPTDASGTTETASPTPTATASPSPASPTETVSPTTRTPSPSPTTAAATTQPGTTSGSETPTETAGSTLIPTPSPTASPTATVTETAQPGFGPLVALVAVILWVVVALRDR